MNKDQNTDDVFQNIKDGFSSFGKKVSDFVDDVMSSDAFQGGNSIRTDQYQAGKEFIVELELPGVEKSDVDIKVYEGVLIVKGEKKVQEGREDFDFMKKDRRFGPFRVDIQLPDQVELENIKAKFNNGVLSVRFPREVSEESQDINVD